MRRICSWCRKDLDSERAQAPDDTITHGICSLCTLKLSIGTAASPQNLVDRLNEPGFLVDGDGVMQGANRQACRLLGQEAGAIAGRLTGDALGCANAKLPGGCGHTVNCSVCAILNSRIATLETGIGVSGVTATRNISTRNGDREVQFTISTDMLDGQVLLRINEVDDPEAWFS
jgi:PAS domain-containing protein